MSAIPIRYSSPDEDSARWIGFPFRTGDIVISTRSKSGTTWVQMICALLVFQTPRLAAPLAEISPWLDWLVVPRDEVYRRLADQQHRRVIKTHTPLDGIPLDARATYLVVARHPLDMAVSLYHQGDNIDRHRLGELTGNPAPDGPVAPPPGLRAWLLSWIDRDVSPQAEMDSLPGVMWHLSDAWARRDEPNIVLLHYDDLRADLEGQMRSIASLLGIDVPESRWPELAAAASFDRMRASSSELAPDPSGVFKDRSAFFRQGRSGAGRAALSDDDVERYLERVAGLAPADLVRWLHRYDVQ